MDFNDVIKTRTSIKKFKTEEICEEKLERIINSAMLSPSWKNKTSFRFVIVDDSNKKEQLADSIENSSEEMKQAVKMAPIVAVVVGEPSDSGCVDGKDMYLLDSAIAMEHFVLGAVNEGYGTCWIASFDEKAVMNSLKIPANFKVVAMTPLGKIDESKPHNPPKNIDEHLYCNEWNAPYSEKRSKVLM